VPEYVIRPATAGDLDACARLVAALDERSLERHRERLARDLAEPERSHLLVATPAGEPDRIVASGRVSRFTPPRDAPADVAPAGWYLIGLVVAPEHRGRGIGRALTEARIAHAFERAPEVWYFTAPDNEPSLRLHAALGFTEVTRDFSFPGAPPELAGVLLRLGARARARRPSG
jgi:ribosomal protein S18 acetylase RimI-like enzyme